MKPTRRQTIAIALISFALGTAALFAQTNAPPDARLGMYFYAGPGRWTNLNGFVFSNRLIQEASPGTPTLDIVTNRVAAPPNFRVVTNWVFNTDRSRDWKQIQGTVSYKRKGIIIVETYEIKSRRTASALTGNQSIGASTGPSVGGGYTSWKEPGKAIAVTNMTGYDGLASGSEIQTLAIRTGVYEYAGATLELWDSGTLYRPTVITTNKATAKAK